MTRRLLTLIVLGFGVVLGGPVAAQADTIVPASQTVVEVTVIGQDVTLNGTSAGSVIVIDGNLRIGPHGRAGHGVTVIGGSLTQAPGARVTGDVFQLAGPLPHVSWVMLGAILLALLAARLVIVWIVVRIARLLAAWNTTTTMLAASRRRPLRSAAVGALLAAGLLAATAVAAVTVIGIVFAAALLGVLMLATSLGVSFALQGTRRESEHTTTIIIALALPVIGDALFALATIVALGAAFHYLIDERQDRTSPLPHGH